jgi:hypothetical protein
MATSNLLVPVTLSVTIVLIVLTSPESNIMRLTRTAFPSRFSVSSKVPLLNRLTETLLITGSPLYGASVPSSFAQNSVHMTERVFLVVSDLLRDRQAS